MNTNPHMKKFLLSFTAFFLSISIYSQSTTTLNLPKDAKVEGSVVDMRTRQPKNNELVIFRSQKNSNEYQGISDENGKFSTRVPADDKYDIYIMGFKDSIIQNVLVVPALRPNSYYKNAFTVNLEFEPTKHFDLADVNFEFGKASLLPESYPILDDLVDYLNRKSNERIEVGGFTDNIGSDAKNLILSLERSKAIVNYLTAKGIASERLVAKGYGAEDPMADNDTEEGRKQNRRTQIKILDEVQ